MVVAVTGIEELKEMEQDGSGEGAVREVEDDEFSFEHVEFALPTEFKEDALSKLVDLGKAQNRAKIWEPLA